MRLNAIVSFHCHAGDRRNRRERKCTARGDRLRLPAAIATALFFWLSIVPVPAQAVAASSSGEKTSQSTNSAGAEWRSIAEKYIDFCFLTNPEFATRSGVHTYDGRLADLSPQARRKNIEQIKRFIKDINAIDYKSLSPDEQLDWNLVAGDVHEKLLELEDLQLWRKDPDKYSSLATESLFVLIERDFAPLEDRLKSAIEREEQVPALLKQGEANIDSQVVPEIYNVIALEQLPGMISFFETTLPSVFKSVKDKALLEKFEQRNKACAQALKDYQSFIKNKLSGKSHGQFAFGEANFKRKFFNEDLAEESIDELLANGESELRRLQKAFKDVAHQIDPDADPLKTFESISSNHPAPDKLIDSVKSTLEEIRSYCVDKPICTIPSEERARVDETPPFERALSFASMSTPGPLEKKAREAFYYVTLPEKDWDPKRTEEHMRSFSWGDLINTSVHEAYPGHYVQFLWVNHAPSTVRKLFGCSSNAEGWAHYCEQMMLDEGFHKGDAKLRLVQIHDALLRMCRYMVGIRMHCRGMTFDEGVKYFITEGYMEPANADRETKRGTIDATYLVYTYGKLKILALRKEAAEKNGDRFDLRAFHDAFLKEGFPPIALVRARMLNLSVPKYFDAAGKGRSD